MALKLEAWHLENKVFLGLILEISHVNKGVKCVNSS